MFPHKYEFPNHKKKEFLYMVAGILFVYTLTTTTKSLDDNELLGILSIVLPEYSRRVHNHVINQHHYISHTF